MKILLLFASILAVITDMLYIWWAKNSYHPIWSIITATILVNITGILWAYSMYNGVDSTTAITVYSILTVIGCSLLGILVFNETLSITNYLGLVLGIIALIMINI